MFFSFKPKTIVIDCFTTDSMIYELYPIKKSVYFYPDWWKNLPKTVNQKSALNAKEFLVTPAGTMKYCDGFINLFNSGFIIPLWSDVAIKSSLNGISYRFSTANEESKIITHPQHQHGKLYFEEYNHGKIECPWYVREKTGVKFHFIQPMWNQIQYLNDIHILPGTVDYKHNHRCHINALFAKNSKNILLSAGTPIAQILPLSENKIEIKNHIVSQEEYLNLSRCKLNQHAFVASSLKAKKIVEKQESKCPFNFLHKD